MTNHAVLTDDHILYPFQGKLCNRLYSPLSQNFDLEDLMRDMALASIDSLWIMPGSRLSTMAKSQEYAFWQSSEIEKRMSADDAKMRFLLCWQRGERRSLKIFFPEHDDRWGWEECHDAKSLYYAAVYLEKSLGETLSWSPSHVGRELMIHLNEKAKRAAWLAQPPNLPPILHEKMAVESIWKVDSLAPWLSEGKQLYFHIIDKNSQYLAAATGVNLGEDDPVHVTVEDAPIEFDKRLPGLYRWERPGMTQWNWAPEIDYYLRTNALHVADIVECWVWPKYHQSLRTWAETLWAARSALRNGEGDYPYLEARGMAEGAVKAIATQSLGLLAHKGQVGKSTLYRPDWWSMIVSQANARMLWRIRDLTEQGCAPIWWNVDALGFLSQEKDTALAVPGILDKADGLGGFKLVGVLPVTPRLVKAFDLKFALCRKELKAMLEEQSHARDPQYS